MDSVDPAVEELVIFVTADDGIGMFSCRSVVDAAVVHPVSDQPAPVVASLCASDIKAKYP